MTHRDRYTFTVLRYVHDVLTGEFVNVGLLMHVPSRNIVKAETRLTIGRLRGVFPDLDRHAFRSTMLSIKRLARKLGKAAAEHDLFQTEQDALSLARTLVASDESSLQWAPVGGGTTSNVDKTFERLFERLVGRYDTFVPNRRTDDDVWRPVREQLIEKKIDIEFEEKIVRGTTDEISFGHAWKNGTWHAYEPISFDLADVDGIKEKARRWRGHLEAVSDGNTEELKVNFVVGAPRNELLMPAYRSALSILKNAPFEPAIYEESSIDRLIDDMSVEVSTHQANAAAP